VTQLQLGLGLMADKRLARTPLVAAVRADFADLAQTDRHAGLAQAAIAAARSAHQLLDTGSPRATRALAELRAFYEQADAVRREAGLAQVDPLAELLASIPDTPAGLEA
jgi:hypothetical protein